MSSIFLANKLKETLGESSASETANLSTLLKNNKEISSTTVGYSENSATSSMVGGDNLELSATSSTIKSSNNSATSSAINTITGNYSATSSAINNLKGGNYSATSSAINNLKGGNLSATSSTVQKSGSGNKELSDIDHLVNMLTEESESSSTSDLENELKKSMNKSMSGGMNINNIKNFFTNLKKDGVNVDIKLDNLSMSEFFDNKYNMIGGAPKRVSKKSSKKSSKGSKKSKKSKKTSKEEESKESMWGGSKKGSKKSSKGSKKGSKKSKKGSKKKSQAGGKGLNAPLKAFMDLKNHVAKGLGLSGKDLITKASKIASAVKKDVEAKVSGKTSIEYSKMGHKQFDDNKDKYQQMCNKL